MDFKAKLLTFRVRQNKGCSEVVMIGLLALVITTLATLVTITTTIGWKNLYEVVKYEVIK